MSIGLSTEVDVGLELLVALGRSATTQPA